MNLAAPVLQRYVVPERLDKALRSIRRSLRDMELDIIDEFEFSGNTGGPLAQKRGDFRLLLVGCTVLEFEAVALERAAAVFFPLHVLVCGEEDQTRVSVANPAFLFDGRLPAGANEPIEKLVGRVNLALDALLQGAAVRVN